MTSAKCHCFFFLITCTAVGLISESALRSRYAIPSVVPHIGWTGVPTVPHFPAPIAIAPADIQQQSKQQDMISFAK